MLRQVRGSLKELTAPSLATRKRYKKIIHIMSNYNIYVDLTSSNPLKFSQNRGNSERLSDSAPNNQNKALLSRIAGDFGNLSQDKPNFAAQIVSLPVQKISFLGGVG